MDNENNHLVIPFNHLILLILISLFTVTFYVISNFIKQDNLEEAKNLEVVTSSNEFSNFTNFFLSKINSPYKEIKYSIKNNDSIEKILKKYNVIESDINDISSKLKRKKLKNIYTGRELSLIIKKINDKAYSVVSVTYPINNTSSIEIRKFKDSFIIKENILKLYKKEVVLNNKIENNLYSAAVEAGIEPNIIIEFARIYGFEIDFQRFQSPRTSIFAILYRKFEGFCILQRIASQTLSKPPKCSQDALKSPPGHSLKA